MTKLEKLKILLELLFDTYTTVLYSNSFSNELLYFLEKQCQLTLTLKMNLIQYYWI